MLGSRPATTRPPPDHPARHGKSHQKQSGTTWPDQNRKRSRKSWHAPSPAPILPGQASIRPHSTGSCAPRDKTGCWIFRLPSPPGKRRPRLPLPRLAAWAFEAQIMAIRCQKVFAA